ncbi:MAG: thioredoxin family protein [Burkholderiales bacterium]|jgi:small redox-active disulfide protein 2|nr:thioredoxin family protein [Burkholderiales bacterium]
MDVKILGTGCARCNRLEQLTREVAAETGTVIEVDHLTDMQKILDYGVTGTPALVVRGEVKCAGRIPRKEEIAAWLAAVG